MTKLEGQKQRLEKFYKEKMGITMDKNQASIAQTLASNKTTDLIGDVSMFQRRIEFLEEQAQERNRLARLE